MKKCALFLFACLSVIMFSGCRSVDTTFIPLEPKFESVPMGGAQTIVLVNTSGRPLYNVKFRAYVWGNNNNQMTAADNFSTLPESIPNLTHSFRGFAGKLQPGEVIHFTDQRTGGPSRILQPVTRVQVEGSCDEGPFREEWRPDNSGQLRLWQ